MTAVTILGPGGVGGFLAAALQRAGVGVTVVARQQTAELIERDGIHLESVRFGAVDARPRAVSVLEEPADLLIVTTKATGLVDALERIDAPPRVVLPLLNGLDHVALLRERWPGARVLAGTIRIEADRPRAGQVTHTSPFLRVDLAHDDPAAAETVRATSELLERAEVPTQVYAREAQALWAKLVRLNALACTTSAFDLLLGDIRTRLRDSLEGAVREGAAVARAEGADIAEAEVMGELDAAHATLGSSMARDIAAGRPPELDAIPGAVLRAAARHGIECPTIGGLVRRVRARLD